MKILILLLFPTLIFSQNTKCNYIEDYYPTIYKAQIQYLQKKYDSAYFHLKKAENKCGLRYDGTTNEIEILAELEYRKKNYKKSAHYLKKLVENGYPFKYIEEDSLYTGFRNKKEWISLKIQSDKIYEKWKSNINWDLRDELIKINEEDQRIRINKVSKEEFERVDSLHENRLKEILTQYGYPTNNLVGNWYIDKKMASIGTLIMHLKDLEYFKPKFYEYVKSGISEASLYASIVDSRDRMRGIFTYRIYSNLKDDQIEDLPNLDKRRISVGLRPWKMEIEYRKLRGF